MKTYRSTSGYVGIGTVTPASALDVSSPSPGAGVIANFRNNNSDVFITSAMSPGDWNYLTKPSDNGIFWTDQSNNTNSSSGFVIAPWLHSNTGIRIDATGAVSIAVNTSNPNTFWTTYASSPYPSPFGYNPNVGWTVPLIIPNGGAIRTASTGPLGRYLGFGMVDGAILSGESSTTYTTGWYWIIQGDASSTTPACYPMTLIMDGSGNATLTVSQNAWQDYVFNDDYKLMSIEEKEAYYKTNKHLPGIDPASIVEKQGLNINKNISGMLQNIEEDRLDITKLYNIIQQQQKEIEELTKKLDSLKQQK